MNWAVRDQLPVYLPSTRAQVRDHCCPAESRFSSCRGKMSAVSLSGGSVLMAISAVVLGLAYSTETEG